jgi:CPA2 family monovalent cation:H+ antiporter-2
VVNLSELVNLLTLIFVTASVCLAVLNKFSHPAIPAYILAGLLLNPFVEDQSLLMLSELGIIFLIFIFGVKFDPQRLKSVAKESQITTTIEIGVVGGLAFISILLAGFNLTESLYFSLFAALSSSLVGLQLIDREVQIDLIHGRLAESVQLIQDIVALVAIAALTTTSENPYAILQGITYTMFLLLAAYGIRYFFFDRLASMIQNSQELLMISSLAILAGFLGASQLMNLNMVVGAFAAGISVAKFPHNMEILDTTGSLKDFFSAIFFISLGTLVTFPSQESLVVALLLVAFTGIVKPAVTTLSLLLQGFDDRTAHLTGFSLDQISEFSLILGITGYLSGAISAELFNGLILAATFTMISSAYTSRHEDFLYQRIRDLPFIPTRKRVEDSGDLEELEDHVILAGYDTQGKRIAEALKSEGAEFVVIENDPEKIEELREKDERYVYGDVMDEEPWKKVRTEDARLIISTVPVQKVSHRILDLDVDTDIILRASEIHEASELLDRGAIYVSVPEVVSSEMLLDHVEGVLQNVNYREELRRRNLLEIKKFIQSREG